MKHHKDVNITDNTRQISAIKVVALMNSVQNISHYTDMICDMTFISPEILAWDCVSLQNVSETLFFINSPIKRNQQADRPGKRAGQKMSP
jgi:hypothetical protein